MKNATGFGLIFALAAGCAHPNAGDSAPKPSQLDTTLQSLKPTPLSVER